MPANSTAQPETRLRRKGRAQLLALILIAAGPMLLAAAMYQWRFWLPEARNYHGSLLGDGQSLADLGISGARQPGWLLLVSAPQGCAQDCRRLLYLARQIHIALGREASRAHHALAAAEALAAGHQQQLAREYPQLARFALDGKRYQQATGSNEPQLWIVDPMGNLVLRYSAASNGKDILTDLRLLLKLSKIG